MGSIRKEDGGNLQTFMHNCPEAHISAGIPDNSASLIPQLGAGQVEGFNTESQMDSVR